MLSKRAFPHTQIMAITALTPSDPSSYMIFGMLGATVYVFCYAARGAWYWMERKKKLPSWISPFIYAVVFLGTVGVGLITWMAGIQLMYNMTVDNSAYDTCEGNEPNAIANFCSLGLTGSVVAYYLAVGTVGGLGALAVYLPVMATTPDKVILDESNNGFIHYVVCFVYMALLLVSIVSVTGHLWHVESTDPDLASWRGMDILSTILACGFAFWYMVSPQFWVTLHDPSTFKASEHGKYSVTVEPYDDSNVKNPKVMKTIDYWASTVFPTLTTQRVGVKMPHFLIIAFQLLMFNGFMALHTYIGNLYVYFGVMVVVPVLCSLTWHKGEITSYRDHAATQFFLPIYFLCLSVLQILAFLPIAMVSSYPILTNSRFFLPLRLLAPNPVVMMYTQDATSASTVGVDNAHYVISTLALVFLSFGWMWALKARIYASWVTPPKPKIG